MNCPVCRSGVLEKATEMFFTSAHVDVRQQRSIPLSIYICSLEECSHIQWKDEQGLVRESRKNRRRSFTW
jgi:hypothetical protein